MAVNLSALAGAGQQFFDNSGVILSGGKLYSYTAGTTTPQTTYTSASGSTAHTNPIVLDSAGRVATGEIWLTAGSNYKFALYTSANVLITTWDNITGINGTGIASNASNVAYDPAGTGAVSTTVQTKLRQYVSVMDFGAVGNGVANDTTAIQNAIASDRDVYFPTGTYLITSACVFSNKQNIRIRGAGRNNTVIKCSSSATFADSAINFTNCSYIEIVDLTVDQNNNSSFTATYPLVIFLTSTYINVANSNFINVTYIGLAINKVQNFWITNNYLEHNTAINSTNYNINVTSSTSDLSRRGFIRNNVMLRSSNIFSGRNIVIDGNTSLSCGYGAGIVTQGDAGFVYGDYVVTNNFCGSGAGVDTDGVNVGGMEIGGIDVVVSNNICNQNGGAGIGVLAKNSVISNNICLGNGQNVGATDPYRSGILMSYVNATYGAHYCTVSGNRCGDEGSGRQKYGYYEQGTATNNVALIANNFAGNVTAETYIQSTSGFYETNVWTSWTPTVTSTTGTITTLGAVTAKYRLEPNTVFFIVSATITTNGTGAGLVNITLPPILGGSSNGNQVCFGRENGSTGKALVGAILNGTQGINVTFYDATYPGANGAIIAIQGFYQVS